jgi:hypothetical protein
MEPEQQSKKRRPASEAVHIRFAVPEYYYWEDPSDEEDDEVNKETRYHLYSFQGWEDEGYYSLLDAEALKTMQIEGAYDVCYKPDPAWGRKSVTLGGDFTLGFLRDNYKGPDGLCTLILKPRQPIWYRCVKLTDEEVKALKGVVERISTRRVQKKPKLQ